MFEQVFTLDRADADVLREEVERLNRRAARLGVKSARVVTMAGGYREATSRLGFTYAIETETVRVSAPAFKINGWHFLAQVEHGEGGNILRVLPGALDSDLPVGLRTAPPACQHCTRRRARVNTYIVRHEDGRILQVGSTCLVDFTGHPNILALAAWLEMLVDVVGALTGGEGEESDSGGSRGPRGYVPGDFLAHTAAAITRYGWVSRSNAVSNNATADVARQSYDARGKSPDALDVSDAHVERARAALAWAQETLTPSSDYEWNIRMCASMPLWEVKHIGLGASILVAFQRAQERAAAAALARAESVGFLGAVGDKLSASGTIVALREIEGRFGCTTLIKIACATGHIVSWFASSIKSPLTPGQRITLTGTVKAHDEYRGECQTVLTRCKIAA